MSIVVDSGPAAVPEIGLPPGPTLSTSRLKRLLTGLAVFLGAFVIREPAPYEIFLAGLIPLFLLFGMRLGKTALSLAALLLVFNSGGLLAMLTMDDVKNIPVYLSISVFLAATSVFWCAYIRSDAGSLRLIFRAYIAGAVVTSLAGIIGYFQVLPGAEAFTLYDRARGLFQDPNVFGPFLILPVLYLVYGLLYRNWVISVGRLALLAILLLGLFLSFSRGAWGTLLISSLIMYGALLATEKSATVKTRLIVMAVLGIAATTLALVVALQFDAVAEMFDERAKLVQQYDGSHLGRFSRHLIGFEWALENPLGIGALEFGLKLGEDTHNIWVKALMAYGWLGFAAWLTLTIITIVGGGRLIQYDRPWRPYLICTWAAFVAHIGLAWVIDIDHWRHVYLMIGIIWGCMGLEANWKNELSLRTTSRE